MKSRPNDRAHAAELTTNRPKCQRNFAQFIFSRFLSTLGAPFELPDATEPITLKQFIRMTYAQSGLPDVAFIVRGHYIEVTTAKHAQEERTRYFDSVSVYDRMHTFWKEMTGVVELDGPEPVILEIN
jgi:hypothetical protein